PFEMIDAAFALDDVGFEMVVVAFATRRTSFARCTVILPIVAATFAVVGAAFRVTKVSFEMIDAAFAGRRRPRNGRRRPFFGRRSLPTCQCELFSDESHVADFDLDAPPRAWQVELSQFSLFLSISKAPCCKRQVLPLENRAAASQYRSLIFDRELVLTTGSRWS